MKQKLFDTEIPPLCEYCTYGRAAASNLEILCVKRGIMKSEFSCNKFKYDPLKRIPRELPKLPEYAQSDFDL